VTSRIAFFAVWLLFCGPAAVGKDFNVREFGAVADGQTDCAGAIQQALDAAGKAGGGRVVIPAADAPYLVKKTVAVRASNIELVADGATLLLADNAVTGSSSHVLQVAGTKEGKIVNVTVRGLAVDGNYWNQAGAVEKKWRPRGVSVTYARNVLLDRVSVKRAWVSLAFSAGAADGEARDCVVTQWHNDAFDAADGAQRIQFVRCKAQNARNEKSGGLPGSRDGGWEIEDGAQEVTLTDCVVENTDATAFKVRSHDTPTVLRDIRFIRCKALTDAAKIAWVIVGRDHDTRTEQVLLEDCQSAGEVHCATGADAVKFVRGEFGQVTLKWPRRVHVLGSTIQKLLIQAEEKSDGQETYRSSIVLEAVKLPDGQPAITGDASMVQIVGSQKRP